MDENENKKPETETGTGTQELLKQILESTEKETKYAKRAARFTMGIFLVLLVAMLILIPKVTSTLTEVNKAVVNANSIVAKADTAIDNIDEMSTSITKTSKSMDSMIEDNSDSLTASVQKLSNIDFDGLNQAIQDLQDAVGPFAKFMNTFKN